MKAVIRYTFVFALLFFGGRCLAQAQAPQATDFKSSPQIVKVFRAVVDTPSKCTVRVRCNGKDAALGTVVAADGWILTKASELTGKITCLLADGKELAAEIKGVHEPYDLALLKIDAEELVPVVWDDSKVATVGRWVASVGPGVEPVAIGVVSVATRRLAPGDQPPKFLNANSGYLGINLEAGEGGAKINQIVPGRPAEKAGLKVGDIVTQAGARKTPDVNALITTVSQHKPGDEITLKIKRGTEELEIKAKLAKRPDNLLGNPQERMGSTLSNRRGEFPFILQHDTVLKHTDCGGPLVDLDSKVVGINIARAGRVETYAIPAEAVRLLLPDLLSGELAPTEEKK